MKILFITLTRHDEPLGIMYLSSILKSRGHSVKGVMVEKEDASKVVKEFKPDVIGYSAMACEKNKILEINSRLKEENEFFSIIGGPLATFSHELIENKDIDALCIGEAEEAFLELIQNLENGNDIRYIKNIFVKINGVIFKNNIRPLIENLSIIPFPDREIFKKFKEGGCYNVITSRGCPFNCTYCYNKKYKEIYEGKGLVVRSRKVDNLIDEMEEIAEKFNPKIFWFQEDHFYSRLDVLKEFAEKYKRRVNIPFICSLRPEVLNDEEVIKILKDANCISVFTGCEAGNDRLRKEILKRNISKEQIYKAAELCNKHGIKIVFFNMLGIPTGDFETDLESLEVNIKSKPYYAWASICTPYPGTELYSIAKENGLISPGYDDELQETYHFKTSLDIPHADKVNILHKVFAVVVEYPELFPIVKQPSFYENIGDEKIKELKKIFDVFKDYKYRKLEDPGVKVPKIVTDFVGEMIKKSKDTNFGRKLEKCRMCDSENLYEFLDLGFMPPADGILSKEELEKPEIFFPLKVCQCQDCGLTQLTYAVNPKLLYGEKYLYESSITETGKRHFFEMADSICKKFMFPPYSLTVDIGSNVGVLLEGFKRNNFNILGIDPAPEITRIANERGIETWQEFINPEVAEKIVREKGKAKIITGTNVFAHIDDKKGLMEAIQIMLDDDGIFVVEAPYLVDLIEKLEYDTIYLDHLEYLSVKPLIKFFDRYGMDLFDVEKYSIHGTSLRFFACKKGKYPISENVGKFLKLEEETNIYSKETLNNFANNVKEHREKFVNLLFDLKKQGKKIIGISAPAKGNTLLNYCKIGPQVIDYMTEKSKIKPGKFTPGMHIPIVSEEEAKDDKADYGVIFAWNFAKEIIKNSKDFADKGGKFIVPIPKPEITENSIFEAKVKHIEPVFSDHRGIITDLLNEKINHVGFITTEAGTVRANHYHNLSTQYSYILSGKFEVLLARAEEPENIKKVILNTGDLMSIPPKVIHAFKAIEKSDMIDMVSESREGTGYEDDVVRVKLKDPDEI